VSAPQFVTTGVVASFPQGTNAIKFQGLDPSGQTVMLPDGYIFYLTFAFSGQLSSVLGDPNANPADISDLNGLGGDQQRRQHRLARYRRLLQAYQVVA
jgi:hypothetical protein